MPTLATVETRLASPDLRGNDGHRRCRLRLVRRGRSGRHKHQHPAKAALGSFPLRAKGVVYYFRFGFASFASFDAALR